MPVPVLVPVSVRTASVRTNDRRGAHPPPSPQTIVLGQKPTLASTEYALPRALLEELLCNLNTLPRGRRARGGGGVAAGPPPISSPVDRMAPLCPLIHRGRGRRGLPPTPHKKCNFLKMVFMVSWFPPLCAYPPACVQPPLAGGPPVFVIFCRKPQRMHRPTGGRGAGLTPILHPRSGGGGSPLPPPHRSSVPRRRPARITGCPTPSPT